MYCSNARIDRGNHTQAPADAGRVISVGDFVEGRGAPYVPPPAPYAAPQPASYGTVAPRPNAGAHSAESVRIQDIWENVFASCKYVPLG